jgi:hypothetical protein
MIRRVAAVAFLSITLLAGGLASLASLLGASLLLSSNRRVEPGSPETGW